MVSRSCCSVYAALGWVVTLQWIRRRLRCSSLLAMRFSPTKGSRSPCGGSEPVIVEESAVGQVGTFRRQNSFQPARCQRIIVSGRTTAKASRQLKSLESLASETRVTGSIYRGFAPRSTGIPAGSGQAGSHRALRLSRGACRRANGRYHSIQGHLS